MALKIGTKAPEFELPSTSGDTFVSREMHGKRWVLYFYPKDFTPGCTKEACSFRDEFAELRQTDIPVFGVSRDSIESHLQFKAKHSLPFELLADVSGEVAKLYDARMPIIGVTKRITYLIDGDGFVAGVHDELFGDKSHVASMLKAIR
ncbi:peroxiredoxin [Pelagicoccus albus]|uniref:thioredoxin-dependent peroxiredoxin n=1 Tax=Pelagicoccus albus TaxID=415222 RepID=A0A7X1B6H6_9BACT|nr:peroxiredoxin [Pelagicoccus albus]MBC2606556.1 peroxiredoxin [Pelagicoccus albus]